MKEISKAYMTLAGGIPILLAVSCIIFRDVQWAGIFVFLIPITMLTVFLGQLFRSNSDKKILHVVGGIFCMVGIWTLSLIIIGAIAISQTGLRGTQ